ncbi:hypothetical protein J132_02927 [Termitomyces sp. J132]|nr:hypothetical protein J132_02927 [Termitomyces sp. J132]
MVDHTNLPATLGALLLGGLFSTILSGALSAQCTLYFNRFPEDKVWLKILAIIIWLNTRLDKPPKFSFPFRRFMDLVETCFIWAILWYYFIAHFGDRSAIDTTPCVCSSTEYLHHFVSLTQPKSPSSQAWCKSTNLIHRALQAN